MPGMMPPMPMPVNNNNNDGEQEDDTESSDEENNENAEGMNTDEGPANEGLEGDDETNEEEVDEQTARRRRRRLRAQMRREAEQKEAANESLIAKLLKKFDKLLTLSIAPCDTIPTKLICNMSFLRVLDLEGSRMRISDYRNIGKCTQLTSLNLSHSDSLTAKTLKELAPLVHLTSLDVSESKKCNSWNDLNAFKKLKKLNLGGCENFNQFHYILTSFPELESLYIPSTGEKSIECMKAIAGCKGLLDLDVSMGKKFTGKHLAELCSLSHLQMLDIGGNLSMNDRDLDCISKLANLVILKISFCKLADFSVITKLPKLQVADLRGNLISPTALNNLHSARPFVNLMTKNVIAIEYSL